VKAKVTYAPRPVYPYEARRQRVTGSGVALLTVDQTSGTVTDVGWRKAVATSFWTIQHSMRFEGGVSSPGA
jgi:hypothetical protein